jgi:hypothetical protein
MKTDTLLERMNLLMYECLPKIISTAPRVGKSAHQPGNRIVLLLKNQDDKVMMRTENKEDNYNNKGLITSKSKKVRSPPTDICQNLQNGK